jgi:hypothetical protein
MFRLNSSVRIPDTRAAFILAVTDERSVFVGAISSEIPGAIKVWLNATSFEEATGEPLKKTGCKIELLAANTATRKGAKYAEPFRGKAL